MEIKTEEITSLLKQQLKEYQIAQEIIADVMNNSQDESILKQAIIQLAKIFEQLVVSDVYDLPITNSIIKNELLNSQFIKVNNNNSQFLTKAISIYDSLRVNHQNNESIYYLAEIKYKILLIIYLRDKPWLHTLNLIQIWCPTYRSTKKNRNNPYFYCWPKSTTVSYIQIEC